MSPPEVRANLRAQFGLDDPIAVRYVRWFTSMLRGDWGFSFVSRVNVDPLILQRLPTTLFVLGSAQLLGLLIALPIGRLSATRPYSFFDQVATTLRLPRLLPAHLLHRPPVHPLLQHLPRLAALHLPGRHQRHRLAVVVGALRAGHHAGGGAGLFQAASMTRFVRSAVLDVIQLDYVSTARAKGLAERVTIVQARRAQRAHPGGHPGGAADAHHLHAARSSPSRSSGCPASARS